MPEATSNENRALAFGYGEIINVCPKVLASILTATYARATRSSTIRAGRTISTQICALQIFCLLKVEAQSPRDSVGVPGVSGFWVFLTIKAALLKARAQAQEGGAVTMGAARGDTLRGNGQSVRGAQARVRLCTVSSFI